MGSSPRKTRTRNRPGPFGVISPRRRAFGGVVWPGLGGGSLLPSRRCATGRTHDPLRLPLPAIGGAELAPALTADARPGAAESPPEELLDPITQVLNFVLRDDSQMPRRARYAEEERLV